MFFDLPGHELEGILDRMKMEGDVLVVDDKPDQRERLSRTLTTYGLTANAVSDAEEALSELNANPYKYKVAVVDIDLPKKNGLDIIRDVLQWRRERGFQTTPEVVCITADPKYKNYKTRFVVEMRWNCWYALKGDPQDWLLAVQTAIAWIGFQKEVGPTLVIRKRMEGWSEGTLQRTRYGRTSEKATYGGFEATEALLNGKPLDLDQRPLQILEYLAWLSGVEHRRISYGDLAAELAKFIRGKKGKELDQQDIENNTSRIRTAIRGVGENAERIICTSGDIVWLNAWVEVEPDTAEKR